MACVVPCCNLISELMADQIENSEDPHGARTWPLAVLPHRRGLTL